MVHHSMTVTTHLGEQVNKCQRKETSTEGMTEEQRQQHELEKLLTADKGSEDIHGVGARQRYLRHMVYWHAHVFFSDFHNAPLYIAHH